MWIFTDINLFPITWYSNTHIVLQVSLTGVNTIFISSN